MLAQQTGQIEIYFHLIHLHRVVAFLLCVRLPASILQAILLPCKNYFLTFSMLTLYKLTKTVNRNSKSSKMQGEPNGGIGFAFDL